MPHVSVLTPDEVEYVRILPRRGRSVCQACARIPEGCGALRRSVAYFPSEVVEFRVRVKERRLEGSVSISKKSVGVDDDNGPLIE